MIYGVGKALTVVDPLQVGIGNFCNVGKERLRGRSISSKKVEITPCVEFWFLYNIHLRDTKARLIPR